MPNPRFAVVDMGSNTLKFSVTEVEAGGSERVLAARAETVRLAAQIAESGEIDVVRIGRAVNAFADFAAIAKDLRASVYLCVGTAALRMASNGDQLISLIEQLTPWRVEVIDGQREARLAFLGLVQSLAVDGSYALLDIGGGSTEVIRVMRRQLIDSDSLSLGSGTLADSCFSTDPPGNEVVRSACSSARRILAASDVVGAATGMALVLSGGNGVFLEELSKRNELAGSFSIDRFDQVVEWLALNPAEITASALAIAVERARMLPAGAAIVQAAIELIRPSSLESRPSGIRGGLIAEWLETHGER